MERKTKVLALVAHDNMKRDLAEWVDWNSRKLSRHHLVCTGTTGKMVEKTLRDHREEHEDETEEKPELKITLLKSGPLGGDQQLGSLIADGKINALIFFWDPMSAQPHDVDVKALLRLATLYNVPTAINRSSADFLISSPLYEDDELRTRREGLQGLCRAGAEIGDGFEKGTGVNFTPVPFFAIKCTQRLFLQESGAFTPCPAAWIR